MKNLGDRNKGNLRIFSYILILAMIMTTVSSCSLYREKEQVTSLKGEAEIEAETITDAAAGEDGKMSSEPGLLYENDDISVAATFSEDEDLPTDAGLFVEEITQEKDEKTYNDVISAMSIQVLKEEETLLKALVYDFIIKIGEDEYIPKYPIDISFKFKDDAAFTKEDIKSAADYKVVHFKEDADELKANDLTKTAEVKDYDEGISEFTFTTEGFSPVVYALTEAEEGEPVASATDAPSKSGVEYYTDPPTSGNINISNRFTFAGGTGYDADHHNVAVINNDSQYSYGAMWYNKMLDLRQPFHFEMALYIAHDKKNGLDSPTAQLGDGMTFTLQNDPKGNEAIGCDGEGLGVYGSSYYSNHGGPSNPVSVVRNALSIEMDVTFNDYNVDGKSDHFMHDPTLTSGNYGHFAVMKTKYPIDNVRYEPGDHINSQEFLKSGNWMPFIVDWTPDGKGGGTLDYSLNDDAQTYAVASTGAIFNGHNVYWGFTGASGYYTSILAAGMTVLPAQPVKDVLNTSGTSINGDKVQVGDILTYTVSYHNYKFTEQEIIIKDKLDKGLEFVDADRGGTYSAIDKTVTWNLENVPDDANETVTFRAKVIDDASVKIDNDADVKIGGDNYVVTNTVTNKVDGGNPVKSVTSPALTTKDSVNIGDKLTYTISYRNDEEDPADITIIDKVPKGTEYVSASEYSAYIEDENQVVWVLQDVPSGSRGAVSMVVEVTKGALVEVGNEATVQVGDNDPKTSNNVKTNIEPEPPVKAVLNSSGTSIDGKPVMVGEVITYTIDYRNFDTTTASIKIIDKLPEGTEFEGASNGGVHDKGTVTWNIDNVKPGDKGKVSFKVKVTEDAAVKIENTAEVSVNEYDIDSNTVTNNIDGGDPDKSVTSPALATKDSVNIGDKLAYTIKYRNDEKDPADIVITDKIPEGTSYVSSSKPGKYENGTVTWEFKNAESGTRGAVTLVVEVTKGALVQIGNTATVKVGDNDPKTSNNVKTKVEPEPPVKDVLNASGASIDGKTVQIDQEITYTIDYRNFDITTSAISISDVLPIGLEVVKIDNGGQDSDGTITWNIPDVKPGDAGKVSVTVKVTEDAAGRLDNTANVVINEYDIDSNTVTNRVDGGYPEKTVTSPALSAGSVNIGDELTYKISYRNDEDAPVKVIVTDNIPEGTEFVKASTGSSLSEDKKTVTWELDNVPSGTRGVVTLIVKVTESALIQIGNTAEVKVGDNDPKTSNEINVDVKPVPPVKDVLNSSGTSIDKKTVKIGEIITYSIEYRNFDLTTSSITITDKLPKGVNFESASNGGVHDKGTVTWTIKDVKPGDKGKVYFKVKVTEEAAVKIENTANVEINDYGIDSNTVTNTIDGGPPKKTVTSPALTTKDSVNIGDRLTYTINYRNDKESDSDIIITDKIPNGTSYVGSDPAGDLQGGIVTWELKNIASGTKGEVTLVVEVTKSALVQIGNTATVDVGGNDPRTSNNVVTKVIPEPPVKDVLNSSGTSIDGKSVKIDDVITYSIEYRNFDVTTASIKITDKLPEGTVIDSVSNGGVHDKGTVTWNIDNVKPGDNGKVFFKVKVTENAAVEIENTASVLVNDYDINSNTVTNRIDGGDPDKSVTSPALTTKDSVNIGDKLTYTIKYRNDEKDPADIVITDKIPEGTSYVSSSKPGKHENGTVTWEFKDAESGTRGAVTLVVEVTKGALVQIGNTATVKVGDNDPKTSNNVKTKVKPEPPVKDVLNPSGASIDGKTVQIDQEITYTIDYRNFDITTASVKITDELPEGLEVLNIDNGGREDNGTITWNITGVKAGDTGKVSVTVRVTDDVKIWLENTANVMINDYDIDSNTVTNKVEGGLPEKTVTSPALNDGSVKVGDELTYTIYYRNHEESDGDITVTDTIPNGTEFVSATGIYTLSSNSQTVTWLFKNTPFGTKGAVSLTVRITEDALVEIGNTATVKIGNNDPKITNTVKTKVEPTPPIKDVLNSSGTSIDKKPVKIGEIITYSIEYRNFDLTTSSITITDKLPKGVSFESASNGGIHDNDKGTVTWTIKDVKPGDKGKVYFKVKVTEEAAVKIENTANVEINDYDIDSNTVTNTIDGGNPEKTVTSPALTTKDSVNIGDKLTYTIKYRNDKESDSDIIITDKIPEGTSYVSSDPEGELKDGIVTWEFKNAESGTRGAVTMVVEVSTSALVEVNNTATVNVGGNDPKTSNNVVTKVIPEPPVKEVLNDGGTSIDGKIVKVGEVITYTIDYRNFDITTASIKITDKLPKGTEFESASNGGIHDNDKGTVTWNIDNVKPGDKGKVSFKVKVTEDAAVKIENTAEVSVNEYDIDSNTVTNNIDGGDPDKSVTSPALTTKDSVNIGDRLTYTIKYRNDEEDPADIVITDKIPEGTSYVSSSKPGEHKNGIVTWEFKNAESETRGAVTLVVEVTKGALVQIGNTATVQVGDNDPKTSNNVKTKVEPEPPVKDVLNASGTSINGKTVMVGDEIEYTIEYRNFDITTASIKITDKLPKGLKYLSSDNDGHPSGSSIIWNIENVKPGDGGKVTIKVEVTEDAAVKADNTANVIVNEYDIDSNTVTNRVDGGDPVKSVTSPALTTKDAVDIGDKLTYTIKYRNDEASAADITIIDKIPAGTEFFEASEGYSLSDDRQTVTWKFKDAESGTRGAVSMVVRVTKSALIQIGNTATVEVGDNGPRTSNEVNTEVKPVPPVKDVINTSGTSINGDAVSIDDVFSYTIEYRNFDITTAAIRITDRLPDGLDFLSTSDGGVYTDNNRTVTWNIPNVKPGETGKVTVKVKVNVDAAVRLDNTATVKIGDHEIDSNTVTNKVDRGDPVKTVTSPALDDGILEVGNELTYNITYSNDEDSDADITIIDRIPDGTEYVGSDPNGEYKDRTVTWEFTDVPSGFHSSVNLVVMVTESALVEIGNTASAIVGDNDPRTSNNIKVKVKPTPPVKNVLNSSGTSIDGKPVKIDEVITYTIDYRNFDITTASIKITDKLPKGTKFDSASNGGVHDNDKGTVTWNIDNVKPGDKGKVSFKVKVTEDAAVNIANTASVSVNDYDIDSNTVTNKIDGGDPNKSVTSPALTTKDSVNIGDKLTYTIKYRNDKESSADIIITDKIPQGTSYVSSSRPGEHKDGTVTWKFENAESGTKGAVTLTVEVTNGALIQIGNTATVQIGDDDPKTSNEIKTKVKPEPPVKDVKNASGTSIDGKPVKVKDIISYTIDYRNFDITTASVKITDKLPKGLKYLGSDNDGHPSGSSIIWNIKDVEPGDKGKVTVRVEVTEDAAVKIENTATVIIGDHEINSNTVTNKIDGGDPDKSVTSPALTTKDSVSIGDKLTYTIKYRNDEEEAADIYITDTIPAGTSYIGSSDGGSLVLGQVTWALLNIPSGTRGAVSFTVAVTKSALIEIGNTATVQVGDNEPKITNEVKTKVEPVPPVKDVLNSSGTSIDGKPVKIGNVITYSIDYKNFDMTTASVKIIDKLPKGLEYVSSDNDGEPSGSAVIWNIKDVKPGGIGQVTVKAKVTEEAAVKIKNTATVIINEYEVDSNTVTNKIDGGDPEKTVTSPALSSGAAKIGDKLTYTIKYRNDEEGPADIIITDKIPDGTKYISSSHEAKPVDGTLTWTFKDMPSGTKGAVSFIVEITENALIEIGNTASVKVGDNDPGTSNEVKVKVEPTPPVKDVQNTSGTSIDGKAVNVDDTISYTISYTNFDITTAAVKITDKLPKGLKYISSDKGGKESDGTVTWTISDVKPGESGKVTVKAKVTEDAVVKIENTAKVIIGDHEVESNTVTNKIDGGDSAKTVTSPALNDGVAEVGDKLTYTIKYRNDEESAADITITDKIPDGTKYISSSPKAENENGMLTWTFKDTPSGTKGEVSFIVEIKEDALIEIGNIATVQVGDNDPRTSNEVKTKINPISPVKDVQNASGTSIDGKPVKVGQTILYTIEYRNFEVTTASVKITDKLPKGLEHVSSDNGGNESGGTVTWIIDDVKPGEGGKVTVTAKVTAAAVDKLDNTATVIIGDHNIGSNTVTNNVKRENPEKTVTSPALNDGAVKVGDKLTYTITYSNYQASLTDITITDKIPHGTKYVSSSPESKLVNGIVTWEIKNVKPGEGGTVTLVVEVTEDSITKTDNAATVKVGDNDPRSTNKVVTTITSEPPEDVLPHHNTPDNGGSKDRVLDDHVKTGDNMALILLILLVLLTSMLIITILFRKGKLNFNGSNKK